MEEYLTTGEVATLLKVRTYTVTDYVRKGLLPAITLGQGRRKQYRIKRSDLDAFVQNRKVVPEA